MVEKPPTDIQLGQFWASTKTSSKGKVFHQELVIGMMSIEFRFGVPYLNLKVTCESPADMSYPW
jgi:hypothetical protein